MFRSFGRRFRSSGIVRVIRIIGIIRIVGLFRLFGLGIRFRRLDRIQDYPDPVVTTVVSGIGRMRVKQFQSDRIGLQQCLRINLQYDLRTQRIGSHEPHDRINQLIVVGIDGRSVFRQHLESEGVDGIFDSSQAVDINGLLDGNPQRRIDIDRLGRRPEPINIRNKTRIVRLIAPS